MPQFLSTTDAGFEAAFTTLLGAKREDAPDVDAAVAAIIADVRDRGDAALIELTAKFDRLELTPETLAFTLDGRAVQAHRGETLLERVGWQREDLNREYNDARQKLAAQLADRVEQTTNHLIETHGLEGEARRRLSQAARDHFHQIVAAHGHGLGDHATLFGALQPSGHRQTELVLKHIQLLPFQRMALCPKQLQHRDTRSQEGTGEPVAGFLFVDPVSQSPFEQ